MARTTDRTPRGQRLVDHAPFGHWRRQIFVAAPRQDRLDAPWVMDGTMNRTTFDTYVETQLAPVLSKGDVIILDNLSSHKSQYAADMPQDRGAWFWFLPPYSPDLTPIGMAFSKLKTLTGKAAARNHDAAHGMPWATSAISSLTKNVSTFSKLRDTEPIRRKVL